MVKIGRQKNRPNTLVSPAPVGWRTLAEKVYCNMFHVIFHIIGGNTIIRPAMAYGSECWAVKKKDENKLNEDVEMGKREDQIGPHQKKRHQERGARKTC